MHQSVKLTGAIWLLQLLISSPLIHAMVWPESSPHPHQDSNLVPQDERQTTYKLNYPSHIFGGGSFWVLYELNVQLYIIIL